MSDMTTDIAEIKALISNKGSKGRRSFKDAAKIGELIQSLADKCSVEEVILLKKNNVFGVTASLNNWLRAARLKNAVMLECNARGLNYDELGFVRGTNLFMLEQEVKQDIAPKRVRKTKSKSKTPLSQEDIILIRSHVFDGKTEEERRERRKQAASEYNVALQLISALTKKIALKETIVQAPALKETIVKETIVQAPKETTRVESTEAAHQGYSLLICLKDFVNKYDCLNMIVLIEDVERISKQCGGFGKLREIISLIKPSKPSKPRNAQKRDNISIEQPSLKSVVYDIIKQHPEGIAIGQITKEVPITGYQSNAKSLSAVVSQALNSLLMEKEIYPTPQPDTNARLYKAS